MGWEVSQDTLAHISDNSPACQRARDLYDVPPLPPRQDRTVINPNDVNDGVLTWYMQQNMSFICDLENPISWTRRTYLPNELARLPNTALDTHIISPRHGRTDMNQINRYPFDYTARGLGRRRDLGQNVSGTELRRELPGVRYEPSVKAAWARRERRKKDRVRRERVRAAGLGLRDLPGI
jgi:hypothetical protein